MDYELQYKRLQAEYTRLTQWMSERGGYEQMQRDLEKVDMMESSPSYKAAFEAVERGEWSPTTTSRPARFAQPQDDEPPSWAKSLTEKLGAIEQDYGDFKSTMEGRWLVEAKRVLDEQEAKFRSDYKGVPQDVVDRIYDRVKETGLDFDQCARLEAFDYMAGKIKPSESAPEAKPAPTTFAPVGGQAPPTSQQSTPKNAEEFERQAEARFKAKLGMT